jgi:type I restriction enzyme R subunit
MGFESDLELAFYDALADNNSAKEVLGDQKLAVIAVEVFRSVKGNASIDWTLKESVQAKLRRDVKRILIVMGIHRTNNWPLPKISSNKPN